MAVIRTSNNVYFGLSTDTKPTNVADGSTFYETDTNHFWDRESDAWAERSLVEADARYHIYKASSSLYKALNKQTGLVKFTSTTPDVGALINDVIGDIFFLGGKIKFSNDTFNCRTKVNIPANQTGFQARPFVFEGHSDSTASLLGTVFRIDTTFPNGNFLFEAVAAGGSGHTFNTHFKNLNFTNPFARGSNGVNIGGGAEMIDAGFINVESDTHASVAGCPFSVENVNIASAWKGIRCAGFLWFGKIWNVGFSATSQKFLGKYHIQMEAGVNHTNSEVPKLFNIQKIKSINLTGVPGGGGDLGGSLDSSLSLTGGYHHVEDVFVNGGTFNKCAFGLQRCFASELINLKTIDFVDNSNGEGTLLLDSTSPDGQVANGGHATHNNIIRDCVFQPTGTAPSIKFKNGAWRNEISAIAYWGGTLTIDDAGAGKENVIKTLPGHHLPQFGIFLVKSTDGLVHIIDERFKWKEVYRRKEGGDYASAGGSSSAWGILAGFINQSPTPTLAADANGSYLVHTTTVANDNAGRRVGSLIFRRDFNPRFRIRYNTVSTNNQTRLWIGFSSNAYTGSDTPLATTNSGVLFGHTAAGTTYVILHHNGDGTAVTTVNTGIAVSDSVRVVEIIADNDVPQFIVVLYDDAMNVLNKRKLTTKIPAATTAMLLTYGISVSSTTNQSFNNRGAYAESN